jgi:hypothetical protein
LILIAFLSLITGPPANKRDASAVWISSLTAGGMLLFDLGVYVVTPLDLPWHLGNSLGRVLLQIWPCFVMLFCRLLQADEVCGLAIRPTPGSQLFPVHK